MAYGQIYCNTDFGEDSNKQTININPSCSIDNDFSVEFKGVSPGKSISVEQTPFQMSTNGQFIMMAWVRFDSKMVTDTSYDQRQIIDLSSNLFSLANGKGYSLFVRKTSGGTITMNWFLKRQGQTRINSSCILGLSAFDLSKPLLIVCSTYYTSNRHQNLRVYQKGVNANNDYVDVEKVWATSSVTFPTNQDLCFGNTSNGGQVEQEFIGCIDEVAIWNFSSGQAAINQYEGLGNRYFNNGVPRLDLTQDPLYDFLNGWYRFGDKAFVENNRVKFPNQSGSNPSTGTGGTAVGDPDFDFSQISPNII